MALRNFSTRGTAKFGTAEVPDVHCQKSVRAPVKLDTVKLPRTWHRKLRTWHCEIWHCQNTERGTAIFPYVALLNLALPNTAKFNTAKLPYTVHCQSFVRGHCQNWYCQTTWHHQIFVHGTARFDTAKLPRTWHCKIWHCQTTERGAAGFTDVVLLKSALPNYRTWHC